YERPSSRNRAIPILSPPVKFNCLTLPDWWIGFIDPQCPYPNNQHDYKAQRPQIVEERNKGIGEVNHCVIRGGYRCPRAECKGDPTNIAAALHTIVASHDQGAEDHKRLDKTEATIQRQVRPPRRHPGRRWGGRKPIVQVAPKRDTGNDEKTHRDDP